MTVRAKALVTASSVLLLALWRYGVLTPARPAVPAAPAAPAAVGHGPAARPGELVIAERVASAPLDAGPDGGAAGGKAESRPPAIFELELRVPPAIGAEIERLAEVDPTSGVTLNAVFTADGSKPVTYLTGVPSLRLHVSGPWGKVGRSVETTFEESRNEVVGGRHLVGGRLIADVDGKRIAVDCEIRIEPPPAVGPDGAEPAGDLAAPGADVVWTGPRLVP